MSPFMMMGDGPPTARPLPKGKWAKVTNFYYDPFKWACVKSWTFFAFGVWVSQQMYGYELMPASHLAH